jgi:general secretion pathway protein K
VSLFDFARPNINAAKPDTLAAMGQFTAPQQKKILDYARGDGEYATRGPQVFQSPDEAQTIAGPTGDSRAFVATISALRIIVTVRDGQNEYRLATVIAPPNGARTIQTTATETRKETSGAAAKAASKQQQTRANAAQANARAAANNSKSKQKAAERNLRYPFTLLEIRENDEIPPPPPPLPNTLF